MTRALFVALALALGLWLLSGVAQVRPEERAVVRRFGRVVARPGPGLWVGCPWPIDVVDRVPLRSVRRVVVGFRPEADDAGVNPTGSYLTGDHNLVNVQALAYYDVDDTDAALDDFVMSRDRAEGVLAAAVEAALAEWVSAHSVDDVLLTGNAALPSWLVGRVQESVEPYKLGVRVRQVTVGHLAPPEDVRPEFDRVNRAQAGIRTQADQAQSERTRKLAQAESAAREAADAAAAAAFEKRQSAGADAAAFAQRLDRYAVSRRTNPDALAGIWWDEMGQLFAGLRERGRVDLLDDHLGPDGLDVTTGVAQPRAKR